MRTQLLHKAALLLQRNGKFRLAITSSAIKASLQQLSCTSQQIDDVYSLRKFIFLSKTPLIIDKYRYLWRIKRISDVNLDYNWDDVK